MPYSDSSPTKTLARALCAGAVALCASALASAQLIAPEVLVVYDSRIADSRSVAEYYAGSAKVPGGAGSLPGIRPLVSVVDISTLTSSVGGPAGVFPAAGDIPYSTFAAQIRDPLRAHLWSTQQARRIRCIVLTKGLPHRIQNIDAVNAGLGDNPASINAYISAGRIGNLTFCSVDAELTLLMQTLNTGEAGLNADSRADGMIINPFFRSPTSIRGYSTRSISAAKTFLLPGGGNNGFFWFNQSDPALSTTLTAGDIYLVARLDGNTVADVRGMIDRAQNLSFPIGSARIVLDSDGGTFDGTGNFPPIDVGPDYALTFGVLQSDGRFPAANIINDAAGSFANFWVGPLINFNTQPGGPPRILSQPALLVATYGANHGGTGATTAATTWASSYNFLPGAIINSIESYNGRSFNGIGGNPFVGQQQIADALAGTTGATFAVGNVWEPFSLTVADNEQIVRSFLLGNLTWVEAAYTALPVLSWQQIVVGDPLATPRRDREDINLDGRVNIDDLYAWQANPVDLNNSGSADAADLALLETSVRGYELAAMKNTQR
ncbi:MAG: hypothetical protein K2W85_12690 [Phycisphaerales bacterium]|nr:hypothetical protein [Phycisphaerales bacterium]